MKIEKTVTKCLSLCLVAVMLFSAVGIAVSQGINEPQETTPLPMTGVSATSMAMSLGETTAQPITRSSQETNEIQSASDISTSGSKGKTVLTPYDDGGFADTYSSPPNGNEINLFSAKEHSGAAKVQQELGYKGAGVKVGVIDSGIDFGNPDINGTQARVQNYLVSGEILVKAENTVSVKTVTVACAERLSGKLLTGTLKIYKGGTLITSGYTAVANGTISFTTSIPPKTEVKADYTWEPSNVGWPEAFDAESMADYFTSPEHNITGMWYADTSIEAEANSTGWLHIYHTIVVDGKNDFWGKDWQSKDYRVYQELGAKGRNSLDDSDIIETNLDVNDLFVTGDKTNWYFGFSTTATSWDMNFALYFDTDTVLNSGANVDPKGNYVDFSNMSFYPEHAIYIRHYANDTMGPMMFYSWDSTANPPKWKAETTLKSLGGKEAYGQGNKFMEFSIPRNVFGTSVTSMMSCLFTTGESNSITKLVYSPKADKLISVGNDYSFRIWNAVSGNMLINMDSGDIKDIKFSNDGNYVAVACGNKTKTELPPILVYDVASGRLVKALHGHTESVWAVAWSHDGKWLASGGSDKVLRLWDTSTWKEWTAFTFDDLRPKVGTGKYYNNSFDDMSLPGNTPTSHLKTIRGIAWSPDDKMIITVSEDKTAKVWQYLFNGANKIGTDSYYYNNRLIFRDQYGRTKITHSDMITAVDWNSQTNRIATASTDMTVKVWDGKTGDQIGNSLVGHSDAVTSVCWSPDGTKLLTTSQDRSFKIWNAADWTAKSVNTTIKLSSGTWSKDGKKIIVASDSAIPIEVYDATTMLMEKTLTGHTHVKSRPQNSVPWNGNTPLMEGGGTPNWSAIPVPLDQLKKIYHPDSAWDTTHQSTIDVKGIVSKSGKYHVGYLPDENTRNLLAVQDFNYPVIVVADTTKAGYYDKVYIDLDKDQILGDDMPAYKGNEIATYDKNGNGYPDVSAGMVYFIANGDPIPYSDVWIKAKPDPKGGPLLNKIPEPGDLVAFMFDSLSPTVLNNKGTDAAKGTISSTDGTAAASAIASQSKTVAKDKVSTQDVKVVQGMAPEAKIVAIRQYIGEDDTLGKAIQYSVEGMDGVPSTGDEPQLVYYGALTTTYDSGYAAISRTIEHYSATYGGGKTLFVVPAGDTGSGYGSIQPPGGGHSTITIGQATDMFYGYFDGSAGMGPWRSWGDVLPSSSRGPSLLGNQGVDVVAPGTWIFASVPVYVQIDASNPLDDTTKNNFWHGTYASAAVSTGLLALVYNAYYDTHGKYPDIYKAKELMMSGADNINYDSFTMGAGYTNAYRSVKLASDTNGISVSPSYWNPGDYRGTKSPGFTSLMYTADNPNTPWKELSTDTQLFTVTNHDSTKTVDVNLAVNVFKKESAEVSWVFNATESDWWMDIKPYIPADTQLLKLTAHTSFPMSGDQEYWLRCYDSPSTTEHPPRTGTASILVDRITQDTRKASVLECTIHDPLSRIHNALWVSLGPAGQSPAFGPWNLTLQFYNKVPWTWTTLNETTLKLNGGESKKVKATILIPSDAPIGTYESQLYVSEVRKVTTPESILKPVTLKDGNFTYIGSFVPEINISLTPVMKELVSVDKNTSMMLLAHSQIYPNTYTVFNKTLSQSIKEQVLVASGNETYVYLPKANKYFDDSRHKPQVLKNNVTLPATSFKINPDGNLTFKTPLAPGDIITATYFWNLTNFMQFTGYTLNEETGMLSFPTAITLFDVLYLNYSFANYPFRWAQLAYGNATAISLYTNGTLMTVNTDYTINYTTGIINFTNILGIGQRITVDYSYFVPSLYIELAHGYQTFSGNVKDFTRIVPGSVVLKNGVNTVPSSDYTVDYMNGIIYFNKIFAPGADIKATYNYGFDSTVPITVNIATNNAQFKFGGETKYNEGLLFNNYDTFGGNDWRKFYTDIPDDENGFIPTKETKFYINASWSYGRTKYDFYTLGKSSRDKAADGNENIFGKYTLAKKDENLIMDNNGTVKVAAMATSNGLLAIGFKNTALNGTVAAEPNLRGSMGLMYVNPTELKIYTNKASGEMPVAISSTAAWDGVGGLARGPSAPGKYLGVKVPKGKESWPAHQAFPEVATIKFTIGEGALILDIIADVPDGVDVDVCVHRDTNGNGVLDNLDEEMMETSGVAPWKQYLPPWKEISGKFGGSAGVDEEVKVLKPAPPGDYFFVMNAFSGGPCEMASVDITIVQGLGFTTNLPVKGINGTADVDPNPVSPNTQYSFNLKWNFAGNDIGIHRPGPSAWQDATYLGVLYVGPKSNPLAFLIPISLTLKRFVPDELPWISNLQPPAESYLNNPYPVIGATIQVDPNSPVPIDTNKEFLYLDGVLQKDAIMSATSIIMQPVKPISVGKHLVKIEVSDLAGNKNSTSWNFTIDYVFPTLKVDQPSEAKTFTNLANYTVTGSTTTGTGITVTINGAPVKVTAGKFSADVALADNSYSGGTQLYIIASNQAGNAKYVNKTIIRDIVPPEFRALVLETTGLPGVKSYTNSANLSIIGSLDATVEYNGVWDVNRSKLVVNVGTTPYAIEVQADGSFAGFVTLAQGSNALEITATDNAGNMVKATRTVILDTEKPKIDIMSTKSASENKYTIEGKVTDNSGIDRVTVNGKDVVLDTDGKFTSEVDLKKAGADNLIVVVAVDVAGNIETMNVVVNFGATATMVIIAVACVAVVALLLVALVIIRKKKAPGPAAPPPLKAEAAPGAKPEEKPAEPPKAGESKDAAPVTPSPTPAESPKPGDSKTTPPTTPSPTPTTPPPVETKPEAPKIEPVPPPK